MIQTFDEDDPRRSFLIVSSVRRRMAFAAAVTFTLKNTARRRMEPRLEELEALSTGNVGKPARLFRRRKGKSNANVAAALAEQAAAPRLVTTFVA